MNDKIATLNSDVADFIFSRDLEKNDLLKIVGSGQTINPNQYFDFTNNKGFMDPNKNNITNFNPGYGYGKPQQTQQGNYGYNQNPQGYGYNQNQNQQGFGYNQNPNQFNQQNPQGYGGFNTGQGQNQNQNQKNQQQPYNNQNWNQYLIS